MTVDIFKITTIYQAAILLIMTKCLEKEEPISLYCELLDIPFM